MKATQCLVSVQLLHSQTCVPAVLQPPDSQDPRVAPTRTAVQLQMFTCSSTKKSPMMLQDLAELLQARNWSVKSGQLPRCRHDEHERH